MLHLWGAAASSLGSSTPNPILNQNFLLILCNYKIWTSLSNTLSNSQPPPPPQKKHSQTYPTLRLNVTGILVTNWSCIVASSMQIYGSMRWYRTGSVLKVLCVLLTRLYRCGTNVSNQSSTKVSYLTQSQFPRILLFF